MKIKALLTIFFMSAAYWACAQLPRIVLQPAGGGDPQVFLNFDDAINAAQANDNLYFSGGSFQTTQQITLDFPVHFIGAGIHPDSSVVTNTTTLTTADAIVITNGGSNSTFTGIRFICQNSSNFQYGTTPLDDDPTGLYFERCDLQGGLHVTVVAFYDESNSETTFNECLFGGQVKGADNSSVNFTKCIFKNGSEVAGMDGGGVIIDHCIFFGNANIGNCWNSQVRNTIFASNSVSPLYQCDGSSVQNCLTYNSQFFGNTSNPTLSNSYTSASNPFVNETNGFFDYTDNLAIDGSSVASGGALDGTDMGIYGSDYPAKQGLVPYNPHFISVNIAPATDGNGNLPVTIKTQAQTY